jgi:hypothetical protein
MTINESEEEEVTGGWKTKRKINKNFSQLHKTINLAADIIRKVWGTCRQ